MLTFNGRSVRKLQTVPRLLNSIKWCLGLALLLLIGAGPALAATITVNTTADNTIAGDGECTLREAITNTNGGTESSGGDCISGEPGDNAIRFDPTLAGSTITLNGSELPLTRSVNISGPRPGNSAGLTIDGNHNSRILNAEASSGCRDIRLSGITLTRGQANGTGGAIRIAGSCSLQLDDVVLTNNRTTGDFAPGGAIGTDCCSTSATLTRTAVTGNHTSGEDSPGGGIFSEDTAVILNSIVSGNWTSGSNSYGGGLVGGELTLEDTVVSGNHTEGIDASGGGISAGLGSMRHATINDNYTLGQGAGGGGIHFLGRLRIMESAVFDNQTMGNGAEGGGIRGTRMEGGICIGGLCAPAGTVSLTNTTISRNSTTGTNAAGGGIAVGIDEISSPAIAGGHVTLINSTMVGNASASGAGGVQMRGETNELSIDNSIIAPANGDACSRPISAGVNNLFIDTSCDGTPVSEHAIGLGGLADNGGPTPTHALKIGSAALDAAGDCLSDHGVTSDQRGVARPIGAACDVGAVEGTGALRMPAGSWSAWALMLLAIAGVAAWQWRAAS